MNKEKKYVNVALLALIALNMTFEEFLTNFTYSIAQA